MASMRDEAMMTAINEAGGPAALGKRLGITSQAISRWRRTPATRVLDVERAVNGRVTRHELRPDLYPLGDHGVPDCEQDARR